MNKIKTVKQGDRLWHIKHGLYYCPRAGFEISTDCPKEYRMVLQECITMGWINPVAYMRDDEYVWEELKE